MKNKLLALEWIGATFGIVGCLLVALNSPISKYGWICYIVANVFIMIWALIKKANGIFIMQVVYMLIGCLAIFKWFT